MKMSDLDRLLDNSVKGIPTVDMSIEEYNSLKAKIDGDLDKLDWILKDCEDDWGVMYRKYQELEQQNKELKENCIGHCKDLIHKLNDKIKELEITADEEAKYANQLHEEIKELKVKLEASEIGIKALDETLGFERKKLEKIKNDVYQIMNTRTGDGDLRDDVMACFDEESK